MVSIVLPGACHRQWCYTLSLHPVFEGFVASVLLCWSLCSDSTMFRTVLCVCGATIGAMLCTMFRTMCCVSGAILYTMFRTVCCVTVSGATIDAILCTMFRTMCCVQWLCSLCYSWWSYSCSVSWPTLWLLKSILCISYVYCDSCGVRHISGDATLCLHYVWRFCVICSVVLIKWVCTLPVQCFMILQYPSFYGWCYTLPVWCFMILQCPSYCGWYYTLPAWCFIILQCPSYCGWCSTLPARCFMILQCPSYLGWCSTLPARCFMILQCPSHCLCFRTLWHLSCSGCLHTSPGIFWNFAAFIMLQLIGILCLPYVSVFCSVQ